MQLSVLQKDCTVAWLAALLTLITLLCAYLFLDFKFLFSSDTVFYTYQKYSTIKTIFDEGIFPFFNRFEGGGVPLFLSGSLDVTAYIFLQFFETLDYMVITSFAYLSLSLVAQYYFLRNIGLSSQASLIGAFLWAFNAFNLQYLHEQVYAVFHVALPICLIAIKQIATNSQRTFLWAVVLTIITSLELLTGRWALIQYSFIVYVAWAITISPDTKKLAIVMVMLIAAILFSFLLTSPFSVPYLVETIATSYRSVEILNPKHPHWLRLLLDHFYPNLSTHGASYYSPLICLTLAILGLSIKSRVRIFCLFLALLFLLFGHDFKLYPLIQKLPFQAGNVVTVRFVLFYYLALSILSAFGYDRLYLKTKCSQRKQYFQNIIYALCIHFLLIVGLSIFLNWSALGNYKAQLSVIINQLLDNDFFGPVITLFLFSLSVFLCSMFLVHRYRPLLRFHWILYLNIVNYLLVVVALTLLLSVDVAITKLHTVSFLLFILVVAILYYSKSTRSKYLSALMTIFYIVFFSTSYNLETDSSIDNRFASKSYSEYSESFTKLGMLNQAPFRISTGYDMPQRINFSRAGIEDINYFLPLPPTNVVTYFRELMGLNSGPASERSPTTSIFSRLANVRYILIRRDQLDTFTAQISNQSHQIVSIDRDLVIIEDNHALERFRLVNRFEVIDSDEVAIQSMLTKKNNHKFWNSTAIIAKDPLIPIQHQTRDCGDLTIAQYSSGHYSLKIHNRIPCLLIVADRFDTNWLFRINGNVTHPIKTNYMFMSLPLKAGAHVIDARYDVSLTSNFIKFSIVVFIFLIASITIEHIRILRSAKRKMEANV